MQNQFRALRPLLQRALAPTAVATTLVLAATLAPVSAASGPPRTTAVTSPATATVTTTAASTVASTVARADRRDRRKVFSPKTGVITTDPRTANKRRIFERIVKSITFTRRKQTIRIISWNVASSTFVDKLIRAHRRGVSVQLLMSSNKAEGNASFLRLRSELRKPRPGPELAKRYRSWARGCERSCRGRRGIAHSKLYIFSRVGNSERVVMSTSANATEVATNFQWNDMYTQVGSKPIYRGFSEIFRESARDRPVKRGYREFVGSDVLGYTYPWRGRGARGDRVINELKRITCTGARGGTGVDGRTRIRIAQDAIIDNRGIEIAKVLRHKWQAGCNIRIVYALMGKQVLGVLRNTSRGPVPIQQVVQDFDSDGVYDRYLHTKVMTVSGYYGKNRSARVAWQGSENWSGLATISDEQGFRINRSGAEGVYTRWVNRLFGNPPVVNRSVTMRTAAQRNVDPYALIREELGLPARRR
ncbi:MAG: phospholipase D-like domain-containing protein [Nocardioides sp.]